MVIPMGRAEEVTRASELTLMTLEKTFNVLFQHAEEHNGKHVDQIGYVTGMFIGTFKAYLAMKAAFVKTLQQFGFENALNFVNDMETKTRDDAVRQWIAEGKDPSSALGR